MNYGSYRQDESQALQSLLISVFSNSESKSEGQLIGDLVQNLISESTEDDLYGFVGEDQEVLLASILLSRLSMPVNEKVFLLAPVAVHSEHQGKGIGQSLINYGLNQLRIAGADFVITYGDPRFYSKVGFSQISDKKVIPSFPLTQP